MDPYIPSVDASNQPSNFTELLTSQQFPETFSPTMGPFPSQIPLSSPQMNVDLESLENLAVGRIERRKWTQTEDVVLCSAWLNTSKDALVGNEQKLTSFWSRICAYFNSSPKLAEFPIREAGNCKQRWHKINGDVCKFVGCYEAAKRQKSSWQNDDDVLKVAYALFLQDHSTKFNLEHAWLELRHDQKWCTSVTYKGDGSSSSKKRKLDDETGSSHPNDQGMDRPEGVKAAKAKAKAKGSVSKGSATAGSVSIGNIPIAETNELFQNMLSMKERDFALKEMDFALKAKQSKMNMLETLLAKAVPLTETEIALKDQLISDMVSKV